MKYALAFKDTGDFVLDENTKQPREFTEYQEAVEAIQSFGHIGEEFITIKEKTNDHISI